MRILVVSDSHGKNDDIKQVMEQAGNFDVFIHLGDVERGLTYIQSLAHCETYMVAGNNDYDIDLPAQVSFELAGKKIFISHGHRMYVGSGLDRLRNFGIANGYDIVMYGHTHIPYLEEGEKLTILNPGSISYPRQKDRKQTYMIIDVDENGKFTYTLKELKSSLKDFYGSFY